jgi:hypothetical protein
VHILRIEHPVPDYDVWKAAFDGDPVGREISGVRCYRVLRPIDNPNYVMIDLEFESQSEAEAMHRALRGLWACAEGTIMTNARARIVEAAEIREY